MNAALESAEIAYVAIRQRSRGCHNGAFPEFPQLISCGQFALRVASTRQPVTTQYTYTAIQ
jgi:hypothetical protein